MNKNIVLLIVLFSFITSLSGSYLAIPLKDKIKIYKAPYQKSKIIGTTNKDFVLNIEYCNKYKWCKIKDEEFYVKQHQIVKIKKDISLSAKPTQKPSKKIVKTTIPKKVKKISTKPKPNILSKKIKIKKTKEYKIALKTFNSKNYEKSFILFEKLSAKYSGDENIEFYYARSAFELKKYEFAFAAYDRVLIQNPNNSRARLELARTLFLMKSYKEAKKEFNKVLISPIPAAVRANIEKFIQAIDAKEKKYILNKIAIFSLGRDNNINNNTYVNNTLYGGLLLNNDTKELTDTNFKAILVGNLIVPNKKNNKLSWESTAIGFIQEQNKYHANDIALTSFSSGLGYMNKTYKNLTSVTYDHIWVGGDQTLYIYGLSNNIKTKIGKNNNILSVDLKYKKKKMIKIADYDKNSNIRELGMSISIPMIKKKNKLILSSTYLTERKAQGTRVDVDKDTNKLKMTFDNNMENNYNTTLSYQIENNKYIEKNANLPIRDDNTRNVTLKISKKLNKKRTVALEVNDIDTKSTINTYTYDKRSISASYTLIF